MESQTKVSQNKLQEFLPKTCLGLIGSTIVSVLALFVLVVMFLLFALVRDTRAIPGPEQSETIGIIFGVAFFVIAYTAPVVLIIAIVFGLPAIFIGWRRGLVRWWTCGLVGFLLGSIPSAYLYLRMNVFSGLTSSANGVQYWINGNPTTAGWVQFLILFSIMGFLGALGGFSFWVIWRFLNPPVPASATQTN